MKRMTPAQAIAAYKTGASYSSDEKVLDALLESTNELERIALCQVLTERGHKDLVNEWHREDLTRKLALVDAVLARI